MSQPIIKIYLMYWLNEKISQSEVENIIPLGRDLKYDFQISKCGDRYLKFQEISANSCDLSDVIDIFVEKFSPTVDKFNLLTELVDGFFVIEIVSKMNKKGPPSLNFGKNFLNLIGALKNLKEIDIDQYN